VIKKVVNGKTELHADEVYSRSKIESWLILRVAREITSDESEQRDIAIAIHAGDTDFAKRRDRIGALILRHDIAQNLVGKKADGIEETFAASFARFYGVPLSVSLENANG
jgi:hypothetical protein